MSSLCLWAKNICCNKYVRGPRKGEWLPENYTKKVDYGKCNVSIKLVVGDSDLFPLSLYLVEDNKSIIWCFIFHFENRWWAVSENTELYILLDISAGLEKDKK